MFIFNELDMQQHNVGGVVHKPPLSAPDFRVLFAAQSRPSKWSIWFRKLTKHASNLYRDCLELTMITPVLAEAFINMAILILCKKEIRTNGHQFEAFIRSQIDTKIFDLP